MLPEISTYALPVALVALGVLGAILLVGAGARTPIPAAALLLLAAAVCSALIPDLHEDVSIRSVERIAVTGLIVILLSGGLDIGAQRLRGSLGDVSAIGIGGTFLTAGGLAVAAHLLLGLEWKVAGVLGAALAPTDPAVMFSVLGRREIAGRSGTVLEGEAGVNDPAGIALLLGMLEVATHADASLLVILEDFAVEMGVGLACGAVAGLALRWVLRRIRLPGGGEHAVLLIAAAVAVYGLTTLVGGSGFLAVFVLGLVLSDVSLPHRADTRGFISGLATLAEIGVFVALGLTIDLGAIDARDWVGGVALALVLAVLVRPVVTVVTLWRSRLGRNERAFIAFAGLKGAVPILLAAFAILAAVPDAQRIYDLVFIVVLLSVAVQGTAIPWVADRLGIEMTTAPDRPWELNLRLANEPGAYRSLTVEPGAWAEGRRLAELDLDPTTWPSLILRDERPVAAHPDLELRAGDVLRLAEGTEHEQRLADLLRARASPPPPA